MADLDETLNALIAEHGLETVRQHLRAHPGLCSNCGALLEPRRRHSFGGLGWCYIDEATGG